MTRLLIAALATILLAFPAGATTVTVAVNHSPPYRIVSDSKFSGFYIEVFDAIAEELGWTVKYREMPFRRILWMMENGDADIMLGALPTSERLEYMDFSVPAFPPEPKRFFHLAGNPTVTEYSDLQGKMIGVLRGSTYSERFDNDPELILEAGVSYRILMGMLAADRLDLVVAPEMVGRHTAAKVSDDILIAPYTIMGAHSYIAISRHSDIMGSRQDLRSALKRIRKNGTFQRIFQRYTNRE
ncbi:substrate-binding periplasmic protein [Marinobacter lacisalsi]|uniref:Substrate-binding periplasmic protein n=1 Tax=Marinobacter lacisalsi TaxID=475979 RepID=A0ABV8QHV0_9GAMM